MHFPTNTGLIFLTDELNNDRYLVDTRTTLSIVPCTSNAGPSGPLLKGTAHEIFRPVWIYLGLNGNRFSFLNFKEGYLILEGYFKY